MTTKKESVVAIWTVILFLAFAITGVSAQNEQPPFDEGFSARQEEFIDKYVDSNNNDADIQMLRLARNLTINEDAIRSNVREAEDQHDKINPEFFAFTLVRLLYVSNSTEFPGRLSDEIITEMEGVLLDFKYWFDDRPEIQINSMTENRQIWFYAAEFLVGQLYPTTVFPGSGKTGAEHMAGGKERALRWCKDKERMGYFEWLSPHFYGKDMAPLITLIDFAEDTEVQNHATIAMDLLVYDIALNSFNGAFGASAGRTAGTIEKLDFVLTPVAHVINLFFGDIGDTEARVLPESVALATSTKYRIPKVFVDIAHSELRFVNKQRNGILVKNGPQYGYGYDTLEDAMFWSAIGAWYNPKVLTLMSRMKTEYNYENGSAEQPVTEGLAIFGVMPPITVKSIGLISCPVTSALEYQRANIITYRDKGGTLSSAQDHVLKGGFGFQQTLWQATLGSKAIVFTTHPGPLQINAAFNDWLGGSLMPKTGQKDNAVIAIYKALPATWAYWKFLGSILLPPVQGVVPATRDIVNDLPAGYTHAYFPQREFDEWLTVGHWTLARKGEGYVALFSAVEPTWVTDGEYANRELRADGNLNVWICELGNQEDYGSFEAFVDSITAALVETDGTNSVTYESPSQGVMEFGWDSPLVVEGEEVDLGPHPRYENPFSDVSWGADTATIEYEGNSLTLDFASGLRTGSAAPSDRPSNAPSTVPSNLPSLSPSGLPSAMPSSLPSNVPSAVPSNVPSSFPSVLPSAEPSNLPSNMPSLNPT